MFFLLLLFLFDVDDDVVVVEIVDAACRFWIDVSIVLCKGSYFKSCYYRHHHVFTTAYIAAIFVG